VSWNFIAPVVGVMGFYSACYRVLPGSVACVFVHMTVLCLLFGITGYQGPEGELRYSSTLSLTSVLGRDGWLTPRPCCFTPWKETRYPLHARQFGPLGRFGRVWKI
jgi:hypothetical protein